MSFFKAEHFIGKHGIDRFFWLLKQLNDGMRFEDIARTVNLSKGRISQIVDALFERRYVLRPGTEEYIRFALDAKKSTLEGIAKEFDHLKKDSHLKLIQCQADVISQFGSRPENSETA